MRCSYVAMDTCFHHTPLQHSSLLDALRAYFEKWSLVPTRPGNVPGTPVTHDVPLNQSRSLRFYCITIVFWLPWVSAVFQWTPSSIFPSSTQVEPVFHESLCCSKLKLFSPRLDCITAVSWVPWGPAVKELALASMRFHGLTMFFCVPLGLAVSQWTLACTSLGNVSLAPVIHEALLCWQLTLCSIRLLPHSGYLGSMMALCVTMEP